MITAREMGRRYDHQATDIAVGRRIAETSAAARTEKSSCTHLRVTHAERGWRRVGQSLRETHHHQVCAHLGRPCARSGGLLCGRRGYELEKKVFKVPFVHSDAERAYRNRALHIAFKKVQASGEEAYRRFCRTVRDRFSFRQRARLARSVFDP